MVGGLFEIDVIELAGTEYAAELDAVADITEDWEALVGEACVSPVGGNSG